MQRLICYNHSPPVNSSFVGKVSGVNRIHPALTCLCYTMLKTKGETLSCDMFESVARGTIFLLRRVSLLCVVICFNLPMTGISLNQPLADIAQVQLNHCNLDNKNHYLHKFHFMPDSLREGK